jgi:hypothetical protein
MTRRTLAETVTDLSFALNPVGVRELQLTRLEAAVPFDVAIGVQTGGNVEVYGDIPIWRWRTAFDREPGRLTIAIVQYGGEGDQP